jgi:hypothetical protein
LGRSWSNVSVGVSGQGRHQVYFYMCNMSEKQGSSPQALWTVTTVISSGEALAYVTFDFIVKLLKTSRGNDNICVFLTSSLRWCTLWLVTKEAVSAKEFAELYVDHVFRLYGLSREFITYRDTRFTSAFWKGVTELLGTRTVMSSSFHPGAD